MSLIYAFLNFGVEAFRVQHLQSEKLFEQGYSQISPKLKSLPIKIFLNTRLGFQCQPHLFTLKGSLEVFYQHFTVDYCCFVIQTEIMHIFLTPTNNLRFHQLGIFFSDIVVLFAPRSFTFWLYIIKTLLCKNYLVLFCARVPAGIQLLALTAS